MIAGVGVGFGDHVCSSTKIRPETPLIDAIYFLGNEGATRDEIQARL